MSGPALPTVAAVVVLLVASTGLGYGILTLCRRADAPWTAPAIGLAALIAAAPMINQTPGRPISGALILAAVAAVGAWAARDLPRRRGALWAAGIVLVVLAWLAIPFLVNGRFGLLGQSVNDDTRFHLWAAEYLARGQDATVLSDGWYPLGPHTVVAMLSSCLGIGVDHAFNALLATGPVVAALAAVGAVREASAPRRMLVGVAVGVPYLISSYYAQGAFKEVILAALVLAFLVQLRAEVRARRLNALAGVPLGVLAAGGLATYTYPALLWFVAVAGAVVAAALAERLLRRDLASARAEALSAVVAAMTAVAVLAITVIPQLADTLRSFEVLSVSPSASGAISKGNIGNLISQLSVLEVFAQWPIDDFRFQPHGLLRELMVVLGLGVAAYGALWWFSRRDLTIPAAAAIMLAIFLVVRERESAYVSAKALVIASPVIVLMGVSALLARRQGTRPARLAAGAATLVFATGLGYSTFLALRNAPVAPAAHRDELRSLQPLVRGSNVLYLGNDGFSGLRLFGAQVTTPPIQAPVPFTLRPEKSYSPGEALDFDSVDDATLDLYAFVLTSAGAYGSTPPPNFRLARATSSFKLWRRVGPTQPREILPWEGDRAAARLDCDAPEGRRLLRGDGSALVVGPATVVPGPPGGGLGAGDEIDLKFRAPAGTHDVSLQYTSPQPLVLTAPGLRAELPANLDGLGPYWPAGRMTLQRSGVIAVRFRMPRASPLFARSQFAAIRSLAISSAKPARTVPLARACGKLVDWYVPDRGS